MRTLLVGQAPARGTSPARPLAEGRSSTRLRDLCGLPLEQYLAAFDRANLLAEWPGPAAGSKGDDFPMAEARAAARCMLRGLAGRRAVLLGRGVAEAFGLRAPPLEWTRVPCLGGWLEAVLLPHPSGVNHWWNSPENSAAAAALLRTEALRGLAFGRRKRLVLGAQARARGAGRSG